MHFTVYDQFPSVKVLTYRSFWNAAVITDEMPFRGGDSVVEKVRRKLAVKRDLRMDEHPRLRESGCLWVFQDNRHESSVQQPAINGFAACPEHAQTREQCRFADRSKKVPPSFKCICKIGFMGCFWHD